ncbi:hypothetical protein [Zunongwangia endophytica]|uniref:DoxX-like family protein n=1 Tax=Zunongwangia endophytica TaxID=1808945 RepID=A0ABV8HBU6_9FLAO|nr:hypothetical protein [Zunongwangia endophytica]MDN3596872.1 hypothetical protein [Zunongwangia endophytica]
MKNIKWKNSLAIASGFFTIVFLSIAFALLESQVYPESTELFGRTDLNIHEWYLLLLKLSANLFSCFLGGLVIAFISKKIQNIIWGCAFITLIIIWLWYSTKNPTLFWMVSILGIFPSMYLGHRLIRKN